MEGLSNSDVALLDRRNDGMLGGEGGAFFWIFALLILAGGGLGFGGGRAPAATQTDLTMGFNNQGVQSQLQQIALSSANNNYETARLVNEQTNTLLQQNNTNLINLIQGFNSLNQTMTTQTNQISQAIAQLGYHLDECCCSIKTQMLQDRLDNTQAALTDARNTISNANQSQYLLNQLGRFVAWTPSGSQTASGT